MLGVLSDELRKDEKAGNRKENFDGNKTSR